MNELLPPPSLAGGRGCRLGLARLACSLLLCAASAAEPPPNPFPATVTRTGSEWRLSMEIPAGQATRVALGDSSGETTLRIGILNPSNEEVFVRIAAGDTLLGETVFPKDAQWQDRRVQIAAPPSGTPVTAEFDASHPFRLGPCELLPVSTGKPNVLFFMMDTIRQDHLGCYGYLRPTSPNIDRFAQDAVLFSNMVPQSSWTRPSVASFLTSTYPPEHGAVTEAAGIRNGIPRLASAMAAAGYETQAIIANVVTLPLWGFGEGFTRCLDADSANMLAMDRENTIARAMEAIDLCAGRPWFIFVHSMGAHHPYLAPPAFREKLASEGVPHTEEAIAAFLDSIEEPDPRHYELFGLTPDAAAAKTRKADEVLETVKTCAVDAYDASIAYNDAMFQRLVEHLKDLGLYDNTLILFVSDHGEEFWDHDSLFHGGSLFEEMLRVPCLLKYPESTYAGKRIDALIEGVDLAPTILEIAGAPPEPGFRGQSVATFPESVPDTAPAVGYSSLSRDNGYDPAGIRMAKTAHYKLLSSPSRHVENWYDLSADPREQSPLGNPPGQGPLLIDVSRRRSLQGVAGVQLYIRANINKSQQFNGTIHCSGIKWISSGQTDGTGSATRSDAGIVTFSAQMKDVKENVLAKFQDPVSGQPPGTKDVWQDFYLTIAGDIRPPVSVRLEVDGAPPAKESVFVGKDRKNSPLEGTAFTLEELAGDETTFATIPRDFGIYLWYIPGVPPVPMDTLDPALREALEAAGYLGSQH